MLGVFGNAPGVEAEHGLDPQLDVQRRLRRRLVVVHVGQLLEGLEPLRALRATLVLEVAVDAGRVALHQVRPLHPGAREGFTRHSFNTAQSTFSGRELWCASSSSKSPVRVL